MEPVRGAHRAGPARLLALALLVYARAAAAQEPPADQVFRLDAAASARSAAAGFAAAIDPLLDSAVTYLHPGAPVVRGAAAVRALLATVSALDSVAVTWYPRTVLVSEDTTLAVSWGSAIAQPRHGGAARVGAYITAWRRGAAGWRAEAMTFGGVLPAAPSPPAALAATFLAPGAGPFAAADSAFAALAGRSGAAEAFFSYAAPDAVTFGREGRVNRGPEAIRRGLAGFAASWRWAPVAAAASRGGDLGWTVGEAEITPTGGATSYSKYLTLWRRTAAGPRFIADGGNDRPATPR